MKIILNCPYEQRHAAKALGARWDPALKKWYVVDPPDLAPFAPWLPDGVGTFIGQTTAAPAAPAKARKRPSAPSPQGHPPAPASADPWPDTAATDDAPPWD